MTHPPCSCRTQRPLPLLLENLLQPGSQQEGQEGGCTHVAHHGLPAAALGVLGPRKARRLGVRETCGRVRAVCLPLRISCQESVSAPARADGCPRPGEGHVTGKDIQGTEISPPVCNRAVSSLRTGAEICPQGAQHSTWGLHKARNFCPRAHSWWHFLAPGDAAPCSCLHIAGIA